MPISRSLLRLLSALWLAAVAGTTAWADASRWVVPDFTATYAARVGIAKGETQLTLRREDDRFLIVESQTRLKGLVSLFKRGEIFEYCRFEYVDGDVLPTVFERRDTVSGEDRNVRVEYDWALGSASVEHAGKRRVIEIEPGVSNTLVLQVALMQAISSGERREWFDAVGHKGRIRFDIRYDGEAIARMPDREVAALRYSHSRSGSGIRTTFWAEPERSHLPVRAEIKKDGRLKGRLQLAKYAHAPMASAKSTFAD